MATALKQRYDVTLFRTKFHKLNLSIKVAQSVNYTYTEDVNFISPITHHTIYVSSTATNVIPQNEK